MEFRDCLEWKGSRHDFGYGIMRVGGGNVYAHRHAWEVAYGPIPAGMIVMHVCDNPPCYRLSHLQLGTHADNVRDMVAKGRNWQASTTCCKYGHPLVEGNLVPSSPGRRCLACSIEYSRAQANETRAAAKCLGMTWNGYMRAYGKSRKVAQQIIKETAHG